MIPMTTDLPFLPAAGLSSTDAPAEIRLLVKRAAAELLAEGTPPTAASVRLRIGHGSAQAVNDALHEWWQDLGRRLAATRLRADHQPQSATDDAAELSELVRTGI